MNKNENQLPTVLIIEDHKFVVEGLEHTINETEIARVVGKGYSIADCMTQLDRHHPDVLLLDIGLPDGNGIDACRQIKQRHPEVKILMLSSYGELAVITRALDEGALGYVLKNALPEEILEGIAAVANGKRFLCEEVDLLLKKKSNQRVTLTGRERELLILIVAGYSNVEIANKMCLAPQTIKGYRRNLICKLNVHNTAQLVKLALEEKLV
jgi:DNA-binding NarL/FixJ family response regulator